MFGGTRWESPLSHLCCSCRSARCGQRRRSQFQGGHARHQPSVVATYRRRRHRCQRISHDPQPIRGRRRTGCWACRSRGERRRAITPRPATNRQTLITIRVGLYDGRGGHRGMPTIFSVLSSANTSSSRRAAIRLMPNDGGGCSDPKRLVC